ncbi:MAG TPA: AraC family transcriptional regulator [Gemmatimonadaceae bacterium]|nr:AraC family transcriptional regulator [Gemmatimonadaceae bacterium]
MTMEAGPARPTGTVTGVAGRRLATVEVAGYRVVDATYSNGQALARHTHPRPALSFVSRGSFHETNKTGLAIVPAGTMHVRPSEEAHANRFEGVGTRLLIVDMPLEPVLADRRIRRLVGRASLVQDGGVRTLAGQLQWELHHRDQASDLAVEGLVLALLAQLVRATSSDRVLHAAPGGGSRLERAREFIDAHFARSLPLTEIAAVAGLHPSSLARAFKRRFEVTPWQYQRRRQIEWVKTELQHGDKPISALAHEAGFADHSHLTRAFQAAEGKAPSAVRKDA